MNRSQPTAAELRVMRADAARVREQQPTADVVDLPVAVEDDVAVAS